jgi:hypothetical protein
MKSTLPRTPTYEYGVIGIYSGLCYNIGSMHRECVDFIAQSDTPSAYVIGRREKPSDYSLPLSVSYRRSFDDGWVLDWAED